MKFLTIQPGTERKELGRRQIHYPVYQVTAAIACLLALVPNAYSQTHEAFFTKMSILDCKEFGNCDWRLSCGLSDQQQSMFINDVTADTGEEIAINRTMSFSSLPVTITCTVKEWDGGIGASWEDLGTQEIKVKNVGSNMLLFDNSEGEVAVHFVVSMPQALSIAPTYTGLFLPATDKHALWTGADWASFVAKWSELSGKGLRLHDLHTYGSGGNRRYGGVFREGTGKYGLYSGQWPSFVAKWQEWSGQGMRLVGLEIYTENNIRYYAGVFLAGTDAHYLHAGANWDSFVGKWKELSGQGLRLVDVETYTEGGQRLWSGVYRAGTGGYALWSGLTWQALVSVFNSSRLVDLETYMDGTQQRYAAVGRAGPPGRYLWSSDWTSFATKWQELSENGYRLVDLEVH